MKEAGKFPQRWCQKNRTNILAVFEPSQAAPLEFHHWSPRAPPAELWDDCSHNQEMGNCSGTCKAPGLLQGVFRFTPQKPMLAHSRGSELINRSCHSE